MFRALSCCAEDPGSKTRSLEFKQESVLALVGLSTGLLYIYFNLSSSAHCISTYNDW